MKVLPARFRFVFIGVFLAATSPALLRMPATASEVKKPRIVLSPQQKEAIKKEVLKSLIKKAEEGDKDYQLILGNMYFEGEGVKKDYQLAFELFLKAAIQGKIEAQYAVGSLYYMGKGVKHDVRSAVQWLKKAASQEHIRAQYFLGAIYYRGEEDGEPDYEQAREWFTRCSKNGDPDAMTGMGNLWEYGKGVDKSPSAAADWYYQAGVTWLKDFNSRDDALASLDMIGRAYPDSELWFKLREAIYSVPPAKKENK